MYVQISSMRWSAALLIPALDDSASVTCSELSECDALSSSQPKNVDLPPPPASPAAGAAAALVACACAAFCSCFETARSSACRNASVHAADRTLCC